MIHVVIPAAGAGSRFVAAGYGPKIFAEVDGVPMLRAVVDNIRSLFGMPHRITVVTSMSPPELGADVEVVQLERPTRGAVETILQAGLDDGPLMVANCDQLMLETPTLTSPAKGWVGTFKSASPNHSYVETTGNGIITNIAEKLVISDQAVSGVYFFQNGGTFRSAAYKVLAEDRRVLGEFYVSAVVHELVRGGELLRTFGCPVEILGTPEELGAYHSRRAVTP